MKRGLIITINLLIMGLILLFIIRYANIKAEESNKNVIIAFENFDNIDNTNNSSDAVNSIVLMMYNRKLSEAASRSMKLMRPNPTSCPLCPMTSVHP